jgi:peptide/nickel transport system substrate-binding protein
VPKHIYAGTDVMKNPAIIAPIGTGPFVFKEWVKGEYVSLSRNPNYWDPPKPYLDSFIVRYVTDSSSRAAMIESGEATYAGNNMIALEDMGRFEKMPNVVLDSKGSDGFQGTHIMEVNLRNPILAKVEVRQAISYAIDRNFIAKNVYAGYATPAWGPIPSKNALYNPGVAKYPYDPKRANQMLDQAGYPRVAGGSRFTLYLDPSNIFAEFGQSAAYIKQALAQVGIDVTIRNFDELVRLGRVYNDYDFDLTVYNLPLVLDPQISIYPYYSTKTIAKGRTNTNAYDYRSAEMDRTIDAAEIEVDPGRRKALIFKLQQIASVDLPIIPLVVPASVNVQSTKLQNAPSDTVFQMTNWSNVWLKA